MGLSSFYTPIEELLTEGSPLLKAAQQPPIKLIRFKGFSYTKRPMTKAKVIFAPKESKDKT